MTPEEAVKALDEKVSRCDRFKAESIDVSAEALRVLLAERERLRDQVENLLHRMTSEEAATEIERLREALASDALFLRRFLGKVTHHDTYGAHGAIVNGYAAAEVPDWEMLQRLDDIEAALAGKARP